MTIEGLMTIAKSSVLKSVAVKDDVDSVVGFINLGLIELYKRFPLNVKEHIIPLNISTEIYTMPVDFMWAVSAYGEVPEDSELDVNILPINVEDNPLSINTVSWNQVQVPLSIDGSFVSIIYVSAPEYLTALDVAVDIQVPPQMIEALLLYIGFLGNEGVDGDVPTSKGSSQYAKFEASCKRVESKGMFTADDLDMSNRITSGGFL